MIRRKKKLAIHSFVALRRTNKKKLKEIIFEKLYLNFEEYLSLCNGLRRNWINKMANQNFTWRNDNIPVLHSLCFKNKRSESSTWYSNEQFQK